MKRLLLPVLLLPALAHASLLASGGTETLLNDGTEAVHRFTSDGTFTLFADATAASSSWAAAEEEEATAPRAAAA